MTWPAIEVVAREDLPLAGQTWVLTGTLESLSRNVAETKTYRIGRKGGRLGISKNHGSSCGSRCW